MKDFSYITNSHPAYIENLYYDFVANPESVDPEMRKFFEGFDFAVATTPAATTSAASNGHAVNGKQVDGQTLQKEFSVFQLIRAYRKKGHLIAKTNPIRERKDRRANLQLANFGLSDADLNTTFEAGKFLGLPNAPLKDIIAFLQKSYTSSVGVEFSGVNDQEKIEWLGNQVENEFHKPLSTDEKKRILEKLNQGVMFEKFLHTKYVGQKRFSLEGGET